MSKIVHASSVVGDDELGDGSQELPVATVAGAQQIADEGDLVAYDGGLGSLVPDEQRLGSPGPCSRSSPPSPSPLGPVRRRRRPGRRAVAAAA